MVLTVRDDEKKNFILDLDGDSQPVASSEYFSTLFPNGKNGDDRLAKIFVTQVSLPLFLKAFSDYQQTLPPNQTVDENFAVGHLLKTGLEALSKISVRDYLQGH